MCRILNLADIRPMGYNLLFQSIVGRCGISRKVLLTIENGFNTYQMRGKTVMPDGHNLAGSTKIHRGISSSFTFL